MESASDTEFAVFKYWNSRTKQRRQMQQCRFGVHIVRSAENFVRRVALFNSGIDDKKPIPNVFFFQLKRKVRCFIT
jgi:hypothetical protein